MLSKTEVTFTALDRGIYTGEISIEELGDYGDFGLGTFNNIDGEMVVLDGNFYQVKVNGQVLPAPPEATSPFADIHFFKEDQSVMLDQPIESLDDLKSTLDQLIEYPNLPYAIQVKGKFDYLKLRSVPAQDKPYPPLADVIDQQSIFEQTNLEGTLVGYLFPAYVSPVGIPGYHFHFISADSRHGGHVLDCRFQDGKVILDDIDNVMVMVPDNADFQNADLAEVD